MSMALTQRVIELEERIVELERKVKELTKPGESAYNPLQDIIDTPRRGRAPRYENDRR